MHGCPPEAAWSPSWALTSWRPRQSTNYSSWPSTCVSHVRGQTRLIQHVDLALASEALPQSEWEEAFTEANDLGLGWGLHRALDLVAETTGVARTRPGPRRRLRRGEQCAPPTPCPPGSPSTSAARRR